MTRQKGVRPLFAGIAIAALTFGPSTPAFAYLKFGTTVNGRSVTLKWPTGAVRYRVTDRGVPGVSATDLQAAAARAFATWEAVPTASISYQFGGFTAALPGQDDGLSTLGFLSRPDLARVLATTSFLIDNTTGELLESDIFFNSAFPWSTAAGGESGKFDLETIALHEIGHLSGLGHSALGETELRPEGGRRVVAAEAIMFPIAFAAGSVSARTLRADDIAGISDIYPDNGVAGATGSISGRITKNGQGLFGAHVVAFDLTSGEIVGNFSLSADGAFVIARLSPGPHLVRVEPLDDVDLDEFFGPRQTVDLNFRVAFSDRVVVVPRGGDSAGVEVKVVAK
jgi:Matrixin